MSVDLFAIVIHLLSDRQGPPIRVAGHTAHALFLNLVQQADPALAEELHQDGPNKPFTVAALPEAQRDQLDLRVSLLRGDLFQPFSSALLQLTPRTRLRLGAHQLTFGGASTTPGRDNRVWAGTASFATIVERANPEYGFSLEFASSTAVGQGMRPDGRVRLAILPTPEIVFPSLLKRWNGLAPEPFRLDEALVKAAAADTVVSRYRLESRTIDLGKGPQKGFVGWASYELPGDPAQARALSLLSHAAFYLGVGMKTARGMGLCRRLSDEE